MIFLGVHTIIQCVTMTYDKKKKKETYLQNAKQFAFPQEMTSPGTHFKRNVTKSLISSFHKPVDFISELLISSHLHNPHFWG